MRAALIVMCSISLLGCAMTPQQKKITGIVAAVLIAGAIAAEKSDRGDSVNGQPAGEIGKAAMPCHHQPDGSCR